MNGPLSCSAVAGIVKARLGYGPHRHTIRRWVLTWRLEHGVDFLRLPGRIVVYPSGLEKILEHLSQLE